MEEFWKNIMNQFLDILYEGNIPEEKTWYVQYEPEIKHMTEDIRNFHQAVTKAGLEISNEIMMCFLLYAENERIGNQRFVTSHKINEIQLFMISADINDALG